MLTSILSVIFFFFSSRRRHTRLQGDWSSDVCSSDLVSLKCSGSVGSSPADHSRKVPRSSSRSIRSSTEMGKWYSHFGQTLALLSTSLRYTIARQWLHLSQRPSGTLTFLRS